MLGQSSQENRLGFLGEDLVVEGMIHSEKKMVVSGKVKGTVSGDQEIVVAQSGKIDGKLEGNTVTVAGNVVGDVLVHQRLEIVSTGNVKGEVRAPLGRMLIQEGALLEGQCIAFQEAAPQPST